MRNIHRYALLAIVAISAGLMLWAVVAGMRAPESDKIASTMQLIGQYDEDCEPIKDSLNQTLPITTNEAGIEAINSATIYQMRNAEGLNYIKTVEEIQSINSDLELHETNYNADTQRLAELDSLMQNDAKAYKKNSKKFDEERKQLELRIAEYNDKGVAELLAKDREWASRIEGVRGSDFEKESALVIEYMTEQYNGFVAQLDALNKELAASQAEYDAALATFDNVAMTFGVQDYATKRKNPNDDLSEEMTDYAETITRVQAAIAVKEKDSKGKAEWKNTLKPMKEQLTEDVIAKVKAYDDLQTAIVKAQIDVDTTSDNVKTVKAAVEAAKADAENLMALATAVSWNIYWLYFLMVFAIVFVLTGFILNFIQDPNWIKIGATTAVIAIVVLIAYFVADGHGWNDGKVLYVLDANGMATDVAFGISAVDSLEPEKFKAGDYMLADMSIWITYLAFILGIAAAVVSSVRGIFKK
jgi:t-SNARE complex subunit (syntaxin)